ncbi:hypothetical protein AcW1_002690 [Taiwanofungus camphoratus]|nr:hypothetical protein AcW1_002690 [Antrodia cinnamomea]
MMLSSSARGQRGCQRVVEVRLLPDSVEGRKNFKLKVVYDSFNCACISSMIPCLRMLLVVRFRLMGDNRQKYTANVQYL